MTLPSAPVPDEDSLPHFEALGRKELRLQRCLACNRLRFPPMPGCPYCGGAELEWTSASGEGEVYSWIIVRRAFSRAFADRVPYALAAVDLVEGPRVVARVEPVERVDFGLEVRATFVEHDTWTELAFRAQNALSPDTT